ncbi:unnamed protein product [Symbiodinium sp. CCMP2592]|nr:unnamed protein product [Symbiodinium sp. CCMP2592]
MRRPTWPPSAAHAVSTAPAGSAAHAVSTKPAGGHAVSKALAGSAADAVSTKPAGGQAVSKAPAGSAADAVSTAPAGGHAVSTAPQLPGHLKRQMHLISGLPKAKPKIVSCYVTSSDSEETPSPTKEEPTKEEILSRYNELTADCSESDG